MIQILSLNWRSEWLSVRHDYVYMCVNNSRCPFNRTASGLLAGRASLLIRRHLTVQWANVGWHRSLVRHVRIYFFLRTLIIILDHFHLPVSCSLSLLRFLFFLLFSILLPLLLGLALGLMSTQEQWNWLWVGRCLIPPKSDCIGFSWNTPLIQGCPTPFRNGGFRK